MFTRRKLMISGTMSCVVLLNGRGMANAQTSKAFIEAFDAVVKGVSTVIGWLETLRPANSQLPKPEICKLSKQELQSLSEDAVQVALTLSSNTKGPTVNSGDRGLIVSLRNYIGQRSVPNANLLKNDAKLFLERSTDLMLRADKNAPILGNINPEKRSFEISLISNGVKDANYLIMYIRDSDIAKISREELQAIAKRLSDLSEIIARALPFIQDAVTARNSGICPENSSAYPMKTSI